MTDIVLSTLNAKYAHCAFGLRYLLANLGGLQSRAALREFNIKQRPLDIVESLLEANPRIVGLGVYIWNVVETTEVVALLKALRPNLCVVLGGPEVSYETAGQKIVEMADYVITGEAEVTFAQLCNQLLQDAPPAQKIIAGQMPNVDSMCMPYHLYTDEDIANRVIYVEASRGCPFRCEFCLSSLDVRVRRFDPTAFLGAMDILLSRGALQFKFIDRTFNLQASISRTILQFFLSRLRPGLFLHFEMIPDRLPDELRDLIAQFPAGTLQFEIGVQTLTPAVEARISRRQNHTKLVENFKFLRKETTVHVHADLIVGLPGETLETLGQSFNALWQLAPQEIQIGILKRLRGTPIVRHTGTFAMVYSPQAPYELLQNSTLNFATLQRLKRMARYWDLVANSGKFRLSVPKILHAPDPFAGFLRFSDWLFAQIGQTHGIALDRLGELILQFLTDEAHVPPSQAHALLLADFNRGPVRRLPAFLGAGRAPQTRAASKAARRQAMHLALGEGR